MCSKNTLTLKPQNTTRSLREFSLISAFSSASGFPPCALVLGIVCLVLLCWNIFTPCQSLARYFGYSSRGSCFVYLFLQFTLLPPKPEEMPHTGAALHRGPAVNPRCGLALPQQPYLPLDLLSSKQHPHGHLVKSLGILRHPVWDALVWVSHAKEQEEN